MFSALFHKCASKSVALRISIQLCKEGWGEKKHCSIALNKKKDSARMVYFQTFCKYKSSSDMAWLPSDFGSPPEETIPVKMGDK